MLAKPTAALIIICAITSAGCRSRSVPAFAERWWQHLHYLAADKLQGRQTGSAGHRRAADYVVRQFQALGLDPAGEEGFFQPVPLTVRNLREEQSSLELLRDGRTVTLKLGRDAILLPAGKPGKMFEAEMVFAGYGLTAPEYGHDDFAGVEATGKVIVFLQGAPPEVPGNVAAHYSSADERVRNMERLGAAGFLVLTNPRLQEIPWKRMIASRGRHTRRFDLADPGLSLSHKVRLAAYLNPQLARRILGKKGRNFDEILELDRQQRPLPKFPIDGRIRAKVEFEESPLVSNNVLASLPATEPRLRSEHVVLSAHLDHLGTGEPVHGDAIYNGAVDNAAGVASLLEVARLLTEDRGTLLRSVVFLACTGEEQGLLGSKYYASRAPVGNGAVIANVNLDAFLPFLPFKRVIGYGMEESGLGAHLFTAASKSGVTVQKDPQPDRNIFIRSDHYSFVKKGVPALFPVVGFDTESLEFAKVLRWFGKRYHSPSDDPSQPINFETVFRFNQFIATLVSEIANAEERPAWREASFFYRFADPALDSRRERTEHRIPPPAATAPTPSAGGSGAGVWD